MSRVGRALFALGSHSLLVPSAAVLVVCATFLMVPAADADTPTPTPPPVAEGGIGMVVDNATATASIFDAGTDTVVGSVQLGLGGGTSGDCSITSDGTLGLVTDFESRIWVIDLATASLASGVNPIPISNFGEDTAISPDDRFLVVSDGSAIQPISVVDIAHRVEVSTSATANRYNSVEVLADGSVVATSDFPGDVYRFSLDGAGTLVNTGEVLNVGGNPNNVFGAPDGKSAVVITRSQDEIRSFTTPGLSAVDTRSLSGIFGVSGLINPAGDRVYARDNVGLIGGGGFVDVFAYDSTTAGLGSTPLFSIPIAYTPTYFGMDQMAITRNGAKLYVSQPGAVNVYNATTGSLNGQITDASISSPTGICMGPRDRDGDGIIDVDDACPDLAGVPENNGCPLSVGGIAGLIDAGDGDNSVADSGGAGGTVPVVALAGVFGAAIIAGGWHTRRRRSG